MRTLVTGAAGFLGSEATRCLHAAGHEVVATDARHADGLPVPLHLVDLTDDRAVYNLLGGVDAVLHLGNIPRADGSIPPSRLLAANVAMTANVLYAAVDRGVRRIVYASSVQATMDMPARPGGGPQPAPVCPFPHLPMTGDAPARPGQNPYALSKAHGEQLLQELCRAHPDLAGVALRLPGIAGGRLWGPPPRWFQPGSWALREGLAQLHVRDAARLFEAALTRATPGHRRHFPAACYAVAGLGPARLAAEHLAHIPVTGPLTARGGLVHLGPLEDDYGWTPQEPTPLLWPKPDGPPG